MNDMSFGQFLFLMFGAPEDANGTHKHECPDCGTVWEHYNDCAGNEKRHVCPGCKVLMPTPWERYFGDKDANFKADKIGRNRKVKAPATDLPMAA